ncbi:MAG: DNA recombination protein RmuC [Synergistetes bacterium]|nr:DNA recombination protein RmuC [Synergistota bacterium]MCX8127483.1 DNA recombination protein RmuC [Synergistota bacterium]MDW8192740.1 DNA recombination protein RmuC [Synergistota bacterium]
MTKQEYILISIVILQIVMLAVFLMIKKEDKVAELEKAFYRLWRDTGFERAIGEIGVHLKQLQEISKFFERALRVPQERGSLGEIALEGILSDQLPPDMFGIRERIFAGKIPDAYIKSTEGIICIDSKFPLDNYIRMKEVTDLRDKEEYKRRFLNDVKMHLSKIEKDYINPEFGTAPYAFVYIPSESIYWFLINEAFDLLREFIKKGVHVVSPLTLSHKVELIKAGVQARRLSERAEKIKEELEALADSFKRLDEKWRIFYDTHLRNLWNKAGEIDISYRELRDRLDRLSKGL